jgi:hypothetical protein
MRELEYEVFERLAGQMRRPRLYPQDRTHLQGRKTPARQRSYRDHLWFSIARPSEEWTSTPVFWFELEPESWSYGLGYYQAKPVTMSKLRSRIDKAPKQFEKLIAPLEKQEEFVLEGPEYVRKKTAPTPKTEKWYNMTSFSLIHSQANGTELFSPELAGRLVRALNFLCPFMTICYTGCRSRPANRIKQMREALQYSLYIFIKSIFLPYSPFWE